MVDPTKTSDLSEITYEGEFEDWFYAKRVSWGAVGCGALVGFGLSFLLNIFNFSIGLSVFIFSDTGLLSLAIGGMIVSVVGGTVIMFIMGWVAGFLAQISYTSLIYGVIHGFAAWCLALLLAMLMSTQVGRMVVSQPYLSLPSATPAIAAAHNTAIQVVTQKFAINPPANSSSNQIARTNLTNPELVRHNVGMMLFVVFITFLLGAIASCLGGYYGMKSYILKSSLEATKSMREL